MAVVFSPRKMVPRGAGAGVIGKDPNSGCNIELIPVRERRVEKVALDMISIELRWNLASRISHYGRRLG